MENTGWLKCSGIRISYLAPNFCILSGLHFQPVMRVPAIVVFHPFPHFSYYGNGIQKTTYIRRTFSRMPYNPISLRAAYRYLAHNNPQCSLSLYITTAFIGQPLNYVGQIKCISKARFQHSLSADPTSWCCLFRPLLLSTFDIAIAATKVGHYPYDFSIGFLTKAYNDIASIIAFRFLWLDRDTLLRGNSLSSPAH